MNKFINTKKAESGNWVLWIVRIFLTLLVITFIVFTLNNTIKKNLEVNEIRFFTLANRILYSDCLCYEENNIIKAGLFDINKLNQESIDKCFSKFDQNSIKTLGLKNAIGGKIEISYKTKSPNNINNIEKKELFYNKEFYEDAKVLTFSNQYKGYSRTYLIFLKDKEHIIPASLKIEFVWRV